MDQASVTRQQKQAYIVQNIDPNYYQDFHQFCTSYAGEIDIDSWTMNYVKQIVLNFKQFLKKRDQQEDKHERSFAVYQTTTGIDAIAGSAKLEMNQILSSLQQQPQNTQIPRSVEVTHQLKPAKVQNISKSPSINKKIPDIQTQASPKPFAKKQAKGSQQQNSAETKKQNKSSAVALLDQIFQQTENPNNQSKIQQSKDKINRSFFDSSNFWDVPTLQEPKQQQQVKMQQKPQPPKPKSPTPIQATTVTTQSPKKQFKSIKLNMNVNQLTNKSGSGSKQSQQIKKTTQGNKSGNAEIQTFNYTNSGNEFDTYFNVNSLPKTAAKSPGGSDLKSQFDTFSQIADDQIQRKRAKTDSVNNASEQNSNKPQTHSTIKLKQIRQFKNASSILQNNSTISSKSKSNKQTYKGSRILPTDFVDQVPCVKTSMRPNMQKNNLYVQIRSFQTIQRSIFSSNYIMYHMRVQPKNIVCKRNYQDFSRLRATLQKFYPGTQLPYLEKEGWRSGTGEQLAKKQGQMLQFFMTDILSNPQLRNSRFVQEFLELIEHKTMKRKLQEYEKMTKLKSIEQLCLMQGKVEVALTENQRIYNEGMRKLVVKLQNNMQKYQKNCQLLSTYYSQAMSTMLSIDDTVKQMQRDIQDFNKTVNIKEVQILQQSLKKIRDNYKQNYFRVKFEKKILQEEILPFLRYEKQNIHVSKDILDKSNCLMNRYLKKIESEGVQAMDASYLSQAYSQYKQGITEDSKNALVLKYQTGYMLAQSSTELQRILQGLGDKINMRWKSIGKQYLEQLGKSVNTWSYIS